MSKPDTAAIRKLFLERSDCLDASSYDVQGLCGRVEELEAELKEWQDYWGCDSPHDSHVQAGGRSNPFIRQIGDEQARANRATNLLAEAAEALEQIRCHQCCARIGNGLIAGCRTCRPTRALLERLRGSR